MANRRRGLLGGLLCFLLGIVVGIGAIAGVLVWAVTSLKLGKINDLTNIEVVGSTEIDGETLDLANMSVLRAMRF